jgi:hypothetical protein
MKYRVTGTVKGRRTATEGTFDTKEEAERRAYKTNFEHPGTNARVVKDSPKVRSMIPKEYRR